MSIANIFNIPTDARELQTWGTLHMIWHRNVVRSILLRGRIALAEYVLDPVDFSDDSTFFRDHQTMHDDLDRVARVATVDLSAADWEDDGARVAWFVQHAQQTLQEAMALGVFS